MKQCNHCGWETANPVKIDVTIRDDFDIKIYLCPECYDAYVTGSSINNKSPVF